MLKKSILSIDIGSYTTKILVGREQGTEILIEDTIIFPTPKDAFYDGRITNDGKLIESIKSHMEKHKVKAKKAICTISSTAIITRELILPLIKEEELSSMIGFEIQQYLPIMLNEYVIEYKIMEEIIEDGVKKARILVAALPKLIAEGYLNLLKELKLKPLALDMHANAIGKLFESPIKINNENYNLEKTVVVIDLGYNQINLNIISKGIAQFSRIIAQGGKDIDINIANAFNLSFDEAESKKMSDGSLLDNHEFTPTAAILNEIIQGVVDHWLQEIRRLFQYYTTRGSGNKIDEIYLYGGSSELKGIKEYLSGALGLPTFLIEDMSNLKASKNVRAVKMNNFFNAAGAIIRK